MSNTINQNTGEEVNASSPTVSFSLGDNSKLQSKTEGTFYIDQNTKQVSLTLDETEYSFDWSKNYSVFLNDYKTNDNTWEDAFVAACVYKLPIVGDGASVIELNAEVQILDGPCSNIYNCVFGNNISIQGNNLIFNNCSFGKGYVLVSGAIYNNCSFNSNYPMAKLTNNKSLYDLECELNNCLYPAIIDDLGTVKVTTLDTKTLRIYKNMPKNTSQQELYEALSGNAYQYALFFTSNNIPQQTFRSETIPSDWCIEISGGCGIQVLRMIDYEVAEFWPNPQEAEYLYMGDHTGNYCPFCIDTTNGDTQVYCCPWVAVDEEFEFSSPNENLVEVNGLIYDKRNGYYKDGKFEVPLQSYTSQENVKTDWETTTYDTCVPTVGAIKAYLSELGLK